MKKPRRKRSRIAVAVEATERRIVIRALRKARGIQAHAAKRLGITERSMWYRVKRLKIRIGRAHRVKVS